MFKFHYKKGACPAAPKALGDAAKGVANAAKAAGKAAKDFFHFGEVEENAVSSGLKGKCDGVAETKAAKCKLFNLNKAGCTAAPDCIYCGPNTKDNRPVGGCYYSGSTCQGIVFKFHYKKGACPAAPKALGDAAKAVAKGTKAAGKVAKGLAKDAKEAAKGVAKGVANSLSKALKGKCDGVAETKAD